MLGSVLLLLNSSYQLFCVVLVGLCIGVLLCSVLVCWCAGVLVHCCVGLLVCCCVVVFFEKNPEKHLCQSLENMSRIIFFPQHLSISNICNGENIT